MVNGSRDPRDLPRFVDPFDPWPMPGDRLSALSQSIF